MNARHGHSGEQITEPSLCLPDTWCDTCQGWFESPASPKEVIALSFRNWSQNNKPVIIMAVLAIGSISAAAVRMAWPAPSYDLSAQARSTEAKMQRPAGLLAVEAPIDPRSKTPAIAGGNKGPAGSIPIEDCSKCRIHGNDSVMDDGPAKPMSHCYVPGENPGNMLPCVRID